jgi:hypothetical protein
VTQLDVWPVLPHAFLLFESMFVEAQQARQDIVAFVRRHVAGISLARSQIETGVAA